MVSNQDRISKEIAISNTGPIISAFQCGKLGLLKEYFIVIYITASEICELKNLGWGNDIDKAISDGDIIVVESLTPSEKKYAECIAQKLLKNLLILIGNPILPKQKR